MILASGSKTDQGQADKFRLVALADGREKLLGYLSIFCTKDNQPRKSLATKAIRERHPEWVLRLEEEQSRICALLAKAPRRRMPRSHARRCSPSPMK